jgi:hypothetical protein
MNATDDESGSLASWMVKCIWITGIAIGLYYLVIDVIPSLYSGWIGAQYLQSSMDKLGVLIVHVLFLSLVLLIAAGICLAKQLVHPGSAGTVLIESQCQFCSILLLSGSKMTGGWHWRVSSLRPRSAGGKIIVLEPSGIPRGSLRPCGSN